MSLDDISKNLQQTTLKIYRKLIHPNGHFLISKSILLHCSCIITLSSVAILPVNDHTDVINDMIIIGSISAVDFAKNAVDINICGALCLYSI